MVSPINGDLSSLPPLYIQVSDSEMLLDDSLRLARRGHTYDVEVNVDLWHKVPHVWQAFAFLPESNEALEKAGRFLRDKIN
jgi:acetyl esterase/lipase